LYEGIPAQFLNKINVFSDGELIEDSTTEPGKAYARKLDVVGSPKRRLIGIVPHSCPKSFKIVVDLIKRGVQVHFVLSPEIVEYLGKPGNREIMRKLLEKHENYKLKVADVKFSAFLADDTLAVNLFTREKPHFDYSTILISKNPSAIKWGEEVFEYYWKKAKNVKAEDL